MKLIIINGPCGVGKSTLAAKIHDSMPLSFLLDVDAQCQFISHGREYDNERWQMSVALTQSIIRTCLEQGRDVIVDKMTYDPIVLGEYHKIGEEFGAEIFELILWAEKETVLSRAATRGWVEGILTPEKCELFWNEVNSIKEKRHNATVIDTTDKNSSQVCLLVKNILHGNLNCV